MAGVISLGVHTPSALPYLIAESMLPEDPPKSLYTWHTYEGYDGAEEEELLYTKDCVVWSQDGSVRRVFRFEDQEESVTHALITHFGAQTTNALPNGSGSASGSSKTTGINGKIKDGTSAHTSTWGTTGQRHGAPAELAQTQAKPSEPGTGPIHAVGVLPRAIVILLKSEAHVHYLSGSSHVVSLPFEIERAFPSPAGIIVQRKIPVETPSLLSPNVPAVPQNSFWASQALRSSQLRSPTVATKGSRLNPARSNPTISVQLDGIFHDILKGPDKSTSDDLPQLYSLTSPLADFCTVSNAAYYHHTRLPRGGNSGPIVEFDMLDKTEELIYVSPKNELQSTSLPGEDSLIIIVTANRENDTVTIWQGWYLKERTLSSLLSERAVAKEHKARRRSSFMSIGTGAATPIPGHRDKTRESFFGNARGHQDGKARARGESKPSQQEEEAAMASQMDPDYQPSQQPPRESRRVSSLISRADVSTTEHNRQTALGASFGTHARRGPSYGSVQDRRSFGAHMYRRSRGSTPGSVFSRSVGPDDDMMDVEGDGMQDELEHIERLIEASHQSASARSVFEPSGDNKKELVIRKAHAMPMASQSRLRSSDSGSSFKILSLASEDGSKNERRITLYMLNQQSETLAITTLKVHNRSTPIPTFRRHTTVEQCTDISRIRDGNLFAIFCATRDHRHKIITAAGSLWTIALPPRLRMFNSLDTKYAVSKSKRDVGRRRTMSFPGGPVRLQGSWNSGQISLTGTDGQSHRIQVQLHPHNETVGQILRICRFVLGGEGQSLLSMWCTIHSFLQAEKSPVSVSSDMEWDGLVITLFTFVVASVDEVSKSAQRGIRNRQHRTIPQERKPTAALADAVPAHGIKTRLTPSAWSWMSKTTQGKHAIPSSSPPLRRVSSRTSSKQSSKRTIIDYAALARDMLEATATGELEWLSDPAKAGLRYSCTYKIMLALHLFREEQKLNELSDRKARILLAPVIAQLGHWAGLNAWSWNLGSYYELEGATEDWRFSSAVMDGIPAYIQEFDPPSFLAWLEQAIQQGSVQPYLALDQIAAMGSDAPVNHTSSEAAKRLLPRISSLTHFVDRIRGVATNPPKTLERMVECGISSTVLETLPEAVLAPMYEAIAQCQSSPPTTWPQDMLRLVGREDLTALGQSSKSIVHSTATVQAPGRAGYQPRGIQDIFHSVETNIVPAGTHESQRNAVASLIFSEDRRFVDVISLMNPTNTQVAECPPQPEWSEVEHLEQQKRLISCVMVRTVALSPGDGMIHFDSQRPMIPEKVKINGFSTQCQVKPMDNIMSADRTGFTEEKLSWAFFHAGVSAGLAISHGAKGIDTSWIVFNKPAELNNRHAGFLFALGINGHLRTLAKWLAFKYLTPKHNMTSVGLLLGLSASHMGTMDTLITRMLSVHITRMLPPGAAELNVSPLTQTAGLMGIGLLYYNTQHRRMSEVMLSELEHREVEDPESTPDQLRDESYRLAAGFALGYINLGKGRDLQGLHGMNLLERLLSVAIGPRPVDVVHIVDQATAGAVIAIALIYMKSEDSSVARKIDIPDTAAQLDHVRPDILLLRTVARHLIMWNEISDEPGWIRASLPAEYASRHFGPDAGKNSMMIKPPQLKSQDIPFFNILTGLAWSLSLKFAGSGNTKARDEVLSILKDFTRISRQEAYYYDAKLARNTVRRCIDVLSLAAATIMAGTGDIETLRYLRRLHGRTDAETTFGSHMAAHLAIGVLFLGGGTYSFGTSDLAIASLLCAFYPIWPADVLDNRVHLQALRHLWVFAAEARCLVVQDIDTQRLIPLSVEIKLRNGETQIMRVPCLLPELDTIATVRTNDPAYWQVTLDFVANPAHLVAFRRNQTVHVRRRPAPENPTSGLSTALLALNDSQSTRRGAQMWDWILTLPSFRDFTLADLGLVLPPDAHSTVHLDGKGTVVDHRLVLAKSVRSADRDALWNLRLLFAWAEKAAQEGEGRIRWIGKWVVDGLRMEIEERMMRAVHEA